MPVLLGDLGRLGYFNAQASPSRLPVASSLTVYAAPRSRAEHAYPKLIHYNKVGKGGHFAAWEQPRLLSEEVRAGFRSLRSGVVTSDVHFAKAG